MEDYHLRDGKAEYMERHAGLNRKRDVRRFLLYTALR